MGGLCSVGFSKYVSKHSSVLYPLKYHVLVLGMPTSSASPTGKNIRRGCIRYRCRLVKSIEGVKVVR